MAASVGGLSQRSRGQASLLGAVLIFGVMLVGILAVVTLGASAIAESQDALSEQRAEKTMTQFDSKAALVALGSADVQQVSFGQLSSSELRMNEQSGWMRVNITNRTAGDPPETVVNETLGSVTLEVEDTALGYQGGGVWRRADSNASLMISPPEFHYRNGTLTLPMVRVSGDDSVSGTPSIAHQRTEKQFPDADQNAGWINPLSEHRVEVTVQSEYYRAWGKYFEKRTDGRVEYHDSTQQATIELVVPANYPSIDGGVVSGATSLTVNQGAQVDSYDSRTDSYGGSGDECLGPGPPPVGACPATTDSKIIASGDVDIENNAKVYGDLELGGELTVDNNAEVHDGNISHEDGSDITDCSDSEWYNCGDNWVNDNASVSDPPSVDGLIDDSKNAYADPDNDNGPASDVDDSDNTLQNCATLCELRAGTYNLSEIDLSNGEHLLLNTTGGDIEIVVEDVTVQNGQTVTIIGNNRVNMYVGGEVEFQNGAEVINAGDNSTQLWLYTREDETATLNNNAQFRGVIYGPGGSDGTHIRIAPGGGNNAEVWGALVGNVDSQANNLWIHYDAALTDIETVPQETQIPRLTYLHITTNEIEVTS